MRPLLKVATKERRFSFFRYSILFFLSSHFFGNAILSIGYGTLIFATLLNIDSLKGDKRILSIIPLSFFLFFFLNVISSAINSQDLIEFLKIEKLLPFVVFPIVFVVGRNAFSDVKFKTLCCYVYFVTASASFVVLLILASINSIMGTSLTYFTYNELANPLGIQPIYYGAFYCLAIIFGADLIKVSGKFKLPVITGVCLLILAVVLLASRTSWLILAIIVPVKLYPLIKKNKTAIYVSLMILFCVSVLVFTNQTISSRFFNAKSNISSYSGYSFRFKIWNKTYELITENPVMGYGINNSQEVLKSKYKNENFRRAYFLELNAHNQYLQTTLDSGVLTLLCLIFILLLLLYYSKFEKNTLLFLLLICLSFLTESYLRRFNGTLFFCFFYLFFLAEKIKPSTQVNLKKDVF